MATANRVEYTIGAKSEGLEDVQRLAKSLDDVGQEADDLRAKAAPLAQQLERVADQQQAITTLRQLGQESRQLAQALETASSAVDSTAAELAASGAATQRFATAQQAVEASLASTRTELVQQRQALTQLKAGTDAAARGTDEYKASVTAARARIAELREAVKAKRTELAQAKTVTAQAAAEEKRLQQAYEAAVATAGKASAAYGASRRAMQDASEAAQALGIDTQKLGAAQQKVQQEAQQARQSLSAYALAVRGAVEKSKALEASTRAQAAASAGAAAAANGQAASMAQMGAGADALAAQLASAKNQLLALVGVGGMAQVAQDVGKLADQWVNLQARLKLSLGAQVDVNRAMADVELVSKRTYTSLEATAALYGKVATAGKDIGVSQQQALAVTESINQAIQISGASAQASEAAVQQFIQGLQSGVIRGDEFNSIMEQAPRLAKAMADGLNVPIGALRGLAEEGQLTSDKVIRALQTQSAAIDKEFGSLPLTIGRSVQNLQTEWLKFVGTLDQSSGASAGVAAGIDALGRHLDDLARVAAATGAALTAAFAVQAVQALRAAAVQMGATGGAAVLLRRNLDTLSKPVTIAIAVTGFEAGYQLGEMLRENSALARKFGVGTAEFFVQIVNDLKLLKEASAAIFTSDTVDAALDRYIQRNIEIGNSFREMYADAEQATEKIGSGASAATEKVGALGSAGTAAGAAVAQGGVAGAAGIAHIGKQADESRAKLEALARVVNTKPPADNGLKDVIRDLQDASLRGEKLDLQLRKNLPQAIAGLSGPELSKFRAEFILAMDGAKKALEDAIKADKPKAEIDKLQAKVDSFERATRTGLGLIAQQAAKNLGVDVPLAFNKVSDAFTKSQDDLSVLIRSLPELKVEGVDTAAVVGQALNKMIDGAQNEAELEAVRGRVQALRGELGEKIADGLLEQAKKKAEELSDALDAATPGINSVREAFKSLGIESDAALKEKAKTAKEAYDAIKSSGTASAREINESWKAMAEASIKANGGVADATIKSEAAARGFAIETDAAGKSVVKSLGEAKGAAKGVGDALGQAGEEGRDALGKVDYAAKMAGKSLDELEKISRKNWDAQRDLSDQAAESNAAANEASNAWVKQQQEQSKYYTEMVKILQKTRMGYAELNKAAWAGANALEELDKQQKAIEQSSGGAAQELEAMRDKLAELDGDEETVGRRRAERDKAEVLRKQALMQLDLQRAQIRKDNDEVARLSAELAAYQEQLALIDQIAAKEAQARQRKAREERKAEREREKQAAEAARKERDENASTQQERIDGVAQEGAARDDERERQASEDRKQLEDAMRERQAAEDEALRKKRTAEDKAAQERYNKARKALEDEEALRQEALRRESDQRAEQRRQEDERVRLAEAARVAREKADRDAAAKAAEAAEKQRADREAKAKPGSRTAEEEAALARQRDAVLAAQKQQAEEQARLDAERAEAAAQARAKRLQEERSAEDQAAAERERLATEAHQARLRELEEAERKRQERVQEDRAKEDERLAAQREREAAILKAMQDVAAGVLAIVQARTPLGGATPGIPGVPAGQGGLLGGRDAAGVGSGGGSGVDAGAPRQGISYVSHITIPGAKKPVSVAFQDGASQGRVTALLRQLADSRGAAL